MLLPALWLLTRWAKLCWDTLADKSLCCCGAMHLWRTRLTDDCIPRNVPRPFRPLNTLAPGSVGCENIRTCPLGLRPSGFNFASPMGLPFQKLPDNSEVGSDDATAGAHQLELAIDPIRQQKLYLCPLPTSSRNAARANSLGHDALGIHDWAMSKDLEDWIKNS